MRKFSGVLLRTHREIAKMSRMTLAKKIGFQVGPSQIQVYEAGESKPTLDTVIALAHAIGVDVKDLTDEG